MIEGNSKTRFEFHPTDSAVWASGFQAKNNFLLTAGGVEISYETQDDTGQ